MIIVCVAELAVLNIKKADNFKQDVKMKSLIIKKLLKVGSKKCHSQKQRKLFHFIKC